MTPQQPKQPLVTKEVLSEAYSEYQKKGKAKFDDGNAWCNGWIRGYQFASIRSRPAPSPIRSMREDEDGHISWQQMNEKALVEHDAAIAAQAREKVLEKISNFIWSKSIDCQNRSTAGDYEILEFLSEVMDKLESLRTGGEP